MANLEEAVEFVDMTNRACLIRSLPIAAITAQKIVDIIGQMDTKDGDFMDQLFSTVRAVVGSLYNHTLEITDKSKEVPSSLTEDIDGLIILLEGVESRCKKMHSQGWLKRIICYESDKSAIRAMTGKLLAADKVLKTQTTPMNAPPIKTLEMDKSASSSTVTLAQDTMNMDAQGNPVLVVNSGMEQVYRDGVLEKSTPKRGGSGIQIGSGSPGARIFNSGNTISETFTAGPSNINGFRSSQVGNAFHYEREMSPQELESHTRQMREIREDTLQFAHNIRRHAYGLAGENSRIVTNSGNTTTSHTYYL